MVLRAAAAGFQPGDLGWWSLLFGASFWQPGLGVVRFMISGVIRICGLAPFPSFRLPSFLYPDSLDAWLRKLGLGAQRGDSAPLGSGPRACSWEIVRQPSRSEAARERDRSVTWSTRSLPEFLGFTSWSAAERISGLAVAQGVGNVGLHGSVE